MLVGEAGARSSSILAGGRLVVMVLLCRDGPMQYDAIRCDVCDVVFEDAMQRMQGCDVTYAMNEFVVGGRVLVVGGQVRGGWSWLFASKASSRESHAMI